MGKKGLMAAGACVAGLAAAGITYEHRETPIRMPESARYMGESTTSIVNRGKALIIIGPEKEYGSEEVEVRTWELVNGEGRNDISCGREMIGVLGLEVDISPIQEHNPGEPRVDYYEAECLRDTDWPVERFAAE